MAFKLATNKGVARKGAKEYTTAHIILVDNKETIQAFGETFEA